MVGTSQGAARFAFPLQLDGAPVASPLKERGYRGDDSTESMLYSLATGDRKSRQDLDQVAERIFLLHRALTIRDMKTKEMRLRHDLAPEWIFEDSKGKAPFSKGTIRMDRKDIEAAIGMFYKEMGWDSATGAPTSMAYKTAGLGDVAAEAGRRHLLPDVA